MIELNEQQWQALEGSEPAPLRLVSPRTGETFVLLRLDEYERLKHDEDDGSDYDDSPWTREELQALAWEAGSERAGRTWASTTIFRISHEPR